MACSTSPPGVNPADSEPPILICWARVGSTAVFGIEFSVECCCVAASDTGFRVLGPRGDAAHWRTQPAGGRSSSGHVAHGSTQLREGLSPSEDTAHDRTQLTTGYSPRAGRQERKRFISGKEGRQLKMPVRLMSPVRRLFLKFPAFSRNFQSCFIRILYRIIFLFLYCKLTHYLYDYFLCTIFLYHLFLLSWCSALLLSSRSAIERFCVSCFLPI